jgi:RHS repeat-associated protein
VLGGTQELVGVAVSLDATTYVSDAGAGVVYRISPAGAVTIALSGLQRPAGLALDLSSRLLIAEEGGGRILRLETTGALTVLATGLRSPRWLAVNLDGSIYISHHGPPPDGLDPAEGREILLLVPGQSPTVVATGLSRLEGLARVEGGLLASTMGFQSAPSSTGKLLRFPVNSNGTLATPAIFRDTGLQQPVGLLQPGQFALVTGLYTGLREASGPADPAKRTIGKLRLDATLTSFADHLGDPRGLTLGPDGSLHLAEGTAGRLLRFRAPAPPLLDPLPAFTNQPTITVTGTADPALRIDIVVLVNDVVKTVVTGTADATGRFSLSVPLTANATNTLAVVATASGGNGLSSVPTLVSLTHTSVSPAVALLQPSPGAFVRQSISLQAQATDASGVASITFVLGGRTLATVLNPTPTTTSFTASTTLNTTTVADGIHALAAVARNRAGATASVSQSLIVDNTAPDTQVTGGPTGESNEPTATLTFTGTDNLTPPNDLQFAWRLDGGAFTAFSSATTAALSGLTDGAHTFEVKARDLAGNEDPTPASRSFTVALRPAITSVTPTSGPVGAFVTIAGARFTPGPTQVAVNGVAAVLRSITATQITTTVPFGAATGLLTVTTPKGTASTPFTVTTTGDFTLSAAPGTVRAIAGDQTSVSIGAGGSGSFTSLVSLSVSAPPVGITVGFSPSNLVAPGASAFVNFTLANTIAPGSYGFTVTGQAQVDGRSVTRSAAFTLEVLAPSTQAITGRVLTAEAVPQPIAGVTVTLGSAFTLTDAGGNFVLLSPPAGANMLLVDGRTASTATAQYPPVEVNIGVNASGPTRVPFVVYLPKLDTAHPITLPTDATGTVTATVQATTPTIPGLVVTIPVGTRIIGPDGNPVRQITITPVPIDRSPMPFPAGVTFPMLFTIQPGGAVPSQPLPITFPNARNASPGSKADLWFFDLVAGNWQTWGKGTVSAEGTQIVSDPGFGLPRFAWHSYCDEVCQLPFPGEAPPAENQPGVTGGEPVDLFTGRFVVRKTDLVLPGRIPVSIERTYWSGLSPAGFFGTGWNLASYDIRLATRGSSLALIQPDQSQLLFAPDGPGRWVNRAAPYMQGAVITQLPGEFIFQVRFKDGTVQRFDRIVGFTNVAALSRIVDRNGNTVTITREGSSPASFGQITRLTEPAGRSLTLVYDSANRIVSVTDPLGRVVGYAYDSAGRLTTVTDPTGGVTTYAYDASNRIVSITDPRGITFITNEYGPNGRVVRQTQADGGVWTFAYTLAGQVVTQTVVTDPRGNPTTSRFTSLGFTLSTTDALGQTTALEYANGSNLLAATTDPLGRVTRFTYDAQGNVTSITDPAGHQRTFTYEPTFNKIASTRDPLGNVTQFAYDANGNLTTITDPLLNRTTLAYNAFGQPLTTTDPLGNTTTFTYDAQGNLATVADPLGNTTTRQYDAVSRLARQVDPRGKAATLGYDPLNRITVIADPLGGTTRFTYDGNGNVLTVADPQGNATTYAYDAMDRLATRTYPLGHSESLTYDLVGNLTRLVNRKGQAATFGYDALNRRTGATYVDATVTYTYDAVGRLTRATDTVGGTIINAYDTLDRLVSRTAALGTVGYTYDGLSRRTTMIVPGQSENSYAYDPASRLTSITQGSSLVQFAYDAGSRRTTLALPNGVTTQSGYDSASRLTSLTYKLAATVLGDLQYTYAAAGNRSQVGGAWARTGLPQPVASATYNANNQQVTFGSQTLTYDLNGNLTSDGTNTYTWTARNQLATISGPVPASFVYDGVGRRMRKTINGTITDVLYDGLNSIQEVSGAAAASLLTGLGVDEYLVRADTSGASALLTDALGSTLALTDTAGAVQTQYAYEPFGATSTTGAPSSNGFQYTGRENDGTGLYYYRARYYHPGLQRFISEDPIGFLGDGPNLYSYVNNNPLSFGDPLGLCRIEARFSHLSLGYHHAFIVTADPDGSQNYYRGGPTAQGPSSGALSSGVGGSASASMSGRKSGSNSGNSSSPGSGPGGPGQNNGPWGQIATTHGPYTPATIDWDPAARSMTVLDNNAPCGPYDARFGQIMRDIQNAAIPYNPVSTNSNAVAREALERAGLSPGRPPVWAPGWNTRLP